MLVMQCPRDTLLKPLAAVIGIVERRNTLPILSNVLLQCGDGALSCLATDLELEVTARNASASGNSAVTLTTSARKLYDIVRSLPEESEIALDLQDNRLLLRSGRSRFTLQTLDATTFPRMPELSDASVELRMPQGALRELLRLTQYAMAQQDIRYYLNGLLLDQSGDVVRLVATDGHRLAYCEGRAEGAAEGSSGSTILPRKLVQERSRLLSDGDEPVTLQIGPQQVRLQMPGGRQFTQRQHHLAIAVGAPLQVAVELGDTQGTAGAMAATALRQGLQCAVGVVDGGGADGVEAHAEISRACSGRERLPALAAAQRLALETRAGGSDLEPGGGGSGLRHSSLILDPRSLIPDLGSGSIQPLVVVLSFYKP